MFMERWLNLLETSNWSGVHSVFMCVGIATVGLLVVLAVARAVRALTGVSLLDLGPRQKGPGIRRASEAGIPGGNEKILIVDDEAVVRETTARLLGNLGYQVVGIASGEAAVSYMESNGADLILLDLRMEPGADGMEAFQRIRKIRPFQKAIVMTAHAGPSDVAAARALGISHCLIKPTPITLLARAIRDELDRP